MKYTLGILAFVLLAVFVFGFIQGGVESSSAKFANTSAEIHGCRSWHSHHFGFLQEAQTQTIRKINDIAADKIYELDFSVPNSGSSSVHGVFDPSYWINNPEQAVKLSAASYTFGNRVESFGTDETELVAFVKVNQMICEHECMLQEGVPLTFDFNMLPFHEIPEAEKIVTLSGPKGCALIDGNYFYFRTFWSR